MQEADAESALVSPCLSLLFVAPGSRGDVEPLVAVAQALLEDGHRVTFACHDVFAELVQRAGCRYARLAGDVRAGAVSRSPSPPAQAEAHWAQQFADLEVAAAAASPSCVCFNWFGQHAQTLAQSLRVPCVALFPAAPTTRTRAFPCPLLGLAQPGGSDCLRTYVLFEAVVWRSHCSPICAWRSRLGLAELGDTGHAALKAPILYGFSETILPPPKDWPSRVVLTGAWTRPLDPAWAPTPALAQFMDQPDAAPVLFASFGSAALSDPEGTTTAVVDGARAAGMRVLLAGSAGGLMAPRGSPKDVFWLPYAPHSWLLPRCAAALHHGGAGTAQAALRAGIPQVVVPVEFDQPFWAGRLHDLGVAPPALQLAAMSAHGVARALRLAREGGVCARAIALAATLHAQPDGAHVAAMFVAQYVRAVQ